MISSIPEKSTSSSARFTFTRKERLKSGDDIKKAFARGKKVTCPGAKLFYIENGKAVNRVAFTFARKYGNAVERNHSRRLSRESYRLSKSRLKVGFDLVLLVYPGKDEYIRRIQQLDSLLQKAGLFSQET